MYADKNVTFSIVPPGGVIGTAAATLSNGQATSVTLPNVWSLGPSSGDTIFEYCDKNFFDNTNGKVRYFGCSHTTGFSGYREYALATDTVTASESVPGVGGQPEHAYSGTDCDDAGNAYWARGQNNQSLIKRNSAGTYSTSANPYGYQWQNLVYHRAMGKVVIGQCNGFRTYDPNTGTWVNLRDTPAQNDMGQGSGTSTYSYKDSCAYIACTNLWKCTAAGVLSQCSTSGPTTLATPDIDGGNNNNSFLIGSGGKLLAVNVNQQIWYEYDEVANTWADITSSIPSALRTFFVPRSNAIRLNAGYIAAYGVILFLQQNGSNLDSQAYLLKRNA